MNPVLWTACMLMKLLLWYCSSYAAEQAKKVTVNSTYSNASYLLEQLLEGYDIRLRPGFGGGALKLEMDMVIASFDSMSEVNMDYTLTMYLHQYWRDERLAWDKTKSNESMTLSGDFSRFIWVPDTFLANDKHSFLHDVTETNKMLRLYSDGYIAYGMRFTSTLACNMNLRYYPLDSQNCTVEIESYGYTTSEVLMIWREGDKKSVKGVTDAEIPQFSILDYETLDRIEETSTGAYQRLSLVFVLRRNIGYFIFQTYLPCILIVMLSWVSFWINHEATSARVALGITTVLTMTTISTGVRQSLPRISYVKSIDIYLVMCFVFVFAALLEYAAVNYSYWSSKARRKEKHKEQSIKKASNVSGGGWPTDPSKEEAQDEVTDNGGVEEQYKLGGGEMTGRMSPLPSLRAHPSNHVGFRSSAFNQSDSESEFPECPRAVFSPFSSVPGGPSNYQSSGVKLRYRGQRPKPGKQAGNTRRMRVLQQLKRKAKSVLPRIRDINLIDKYRVIFPVSFILFNAFYWCYYTILAE